ncbi:hypothetical protein BT63DRAFT_55649 [Microthyrium microscopicum]|uniref:BTB domain-containing protein n=1 Tax=Microthyrium microscopicum TaxID=703497 RepID=A0A6A6U1Y9_9PEZI|nr:hypothetical protein BT63DRAFT_55649 [Microthyrium microscopicum]
MFTLCSFYQNDLFSYYFNHDQARNLSFDSYKSSTAFLMDENNRMVPFQDALITLRVDDRCFTTACSNLSLKTTFFEKMVTARCDSGLQDAGYFVDVDPNAFEHILRYLRRGIFPLFWDKVKGHDYAMYNAVLEDARYLAIAPLVKWIEEEKYHSAIELNYDIGDSGADDDKEWKDDSKYDLQVHAALQKHSESKGKIEDQGITPYFWKHLFVRRAVVFRRDILVDREEAVVEREVVVRVEGESTGTREVVMDQGS